MYLDMIGSRCTGWAMVSSTNGEAFGPVFDTYSQIKHFIGFWLTKHLDDKYCDAHQKWYDKYFNENEDFTGDPEEWKYEELSVELRDSECSDSDLYSDSDGYSDSDECSDSDGYSDSDEYSDSDSDSN